MFLTKTDLAHRVVILYGLSGFASLAYQVVWYRLFVDKFGSTNLTFVLVVTAFITGIGLGALLSRRVTEALGRLLRLGDPLRQYGAVEVLITVSMTLTVACVALPENLGISWPYTQDAAGIYGHTVQYQAMRAGLASVCVFVPCFLMGLTYPLLCHAFPQSARFPSALYAWNTLGACLGVLASEFVLLARLGYDGTLYVAMMLNLWIGVYFLAWHRKQAPVFSQPSNGTPRTTALEAGNSGSSWRTGPLLACALIGGLLSGTLEGDVFKRISFVGCDTEAAMSFISFWAILAIFVGSTLVRMLPKLRLRHIGFALVVSFTVYFAIWNAVYDFKGWLSARVAGPALRAMAEGTLVTQSGGVSVHVFISSLSVVFFFVGVFVFLPFCCVASILPYVCDRFHASNRHVGIPYGLNTLAFCAGLIGFAWAAPLVSVFYSLKLFFVFAAVLTLLLLLIGLTKRLNWWKPAAAALGLLTAVLFMPRGFDRSMVDPESDAFIYPVRALKSNGAHTTYVVAAPASNRLFFDGHCMSDTSPRSQQYMRLMAHFPLLMHPNPKTALLICFGVGNTAAAIARHETIVHIDTLELNDKVFETAPQFSRTNEEVHLDDRMRMIHDDGRNFLQFADRTYDLVTSEPPPPMQSGVWRLYSEEYYESVMSHLSPRGMMTQWLPVWQMPRSGVEKAVSTFVHVFPHAVLFVGCDDEFILLGSPAPLDFTVLERRFGISASVTADLRQWGIREPADLLARVVQTDKMLRRHYGSFRTISDRRNDFAYLFRPPEGEVVISYNPAAVIVGLEVERLTCGARLQGMLMDLGRLREAVPDFPIASLMSVRNSGVAGVARADVDWRQVARLERIASGAAAAGQPSQAMTAYRAALRLAGEQSGVLAGLASLEMQTGQFERAMETWLRYGRLRPRDGQAECSIGMCLNSLGRYDEAVPHLLAAIELTPQWSAPHGLLGDAFLHQNRYHDALRAYERSSELDPSNEILVRKIQAVRAQLSN